jgi:hypothetical protein
VIALGIFFGCVVMMLGLVVATDAVERLWNRQGRRSMPSYEDKAETAQWGRSTRPRIPAPGTNGRGGIYKVGCKDCGTEIEWRWTTFEALTVLDHYDRCEYCADLEELYGGVKAGAPRQPGQPSRRNLSDRISPAALRPHPKSASGPASETCNPWGPHPSADISSYRMERIRG